MDSTRGLVDRFLARQTENTRRAYARDLRAFASWIGAADASEAAGLLLASPGRANQLVHDYLAHLKAGGRAPATINRRLAALRSLVRLARSIGVVEWTLDIPGERQRRYRDTRDPDPADARRLIEALARPDAQGARDRAILRLLWDLGLRRSEVCELDLEHLDLKAGTLDVGTGEARRQPLSLPEETRAALRAWLDHRGLDPGPLFWSLDAAAHSRASAPQRLSSTSIYRNLRRLGDRVQVRACPRSLRHGAITTVLELSGGDVRAAQRFSRHRDVRTLLAYDDNREDLGGKMARLVASVI